MAGRNRRTGVPAHPRGDAHGVSASAEKLSTSVGRKCPEESVDLENRQSASPVPSSSPQGHLSPKDPAA
jgi:hypothetical protein